MNKVNNRPHPRPFNIYREKNHIWNSVYLIAKLFGTHVASNCSSVQQLLPPTLLQQDNQRKTHLAKFAGGQLSDLLFVVRSLVALLLNVLPIESEQCSVLIQLSSVPQLFAIGLCLSLSSSSSVGVQLAGTWLVHVRLTKRKIYPTRYTPPAQIGVIASTPLAAGSFAPRATCASPNAVIISLNLSRSAAALSNCHRAFTTSSSMFEVGSIQTRHSFLFIDDARAYSFG